MVNKGNKVERDGSVVLFVSLLFGWVYLWVGGLLCGLKVKWVRGVVWGM